MHLLSFKFITVFFHCCFVCVCLCLPASVCLCMYSYWENLFSLNKVVLFSSGVHLVLDNQLCRFLPKEDCFSHSQHFLMACSSLCSITPLQPPPPHLTLVNIFLSIGVLFVELSLRQSCWWDCMRVAVTLLGDIISEQTPCSFGSYSLSISSSTMITESWVQELCALALGSITAFPLVLVFCRDLHLF